MKNFSLQKGKTYDYSKVSGPRVQRTLFDRSYKHGLTFNAGYIIPFYYDFVFPGDTFTANMKAMIRYTSALKVPLMDNQVLKSAYFFCPARLLTDVWEALCTSWDPISSTPVEESLPYVTTSGNQFTVGSLGDYLGYPLAEDFTFAGSRPHSLFLRMYNRTWNEWFRDENLQSEVPFDITAATDGVANFTLLKANKWHDKFTSCLPFPQKGPEVSLGMAGEAIVTLDATTTDPGILTDISSGSSSPIPGATGITTGAGANAGEIQTSGAVAWATYDPNGTLKIDGADIVMSSINDIRRGLALQHLFERDARGGTRFVEVLQAHFGVSVPDYRLQRVEYLGGGSTPLSTHLVAQTAATSGSNALGQLGAFGTGIVMNHGFKKSFVEHGVVLGLMWVKTENTYFQGLSKMHSMSTRFDLLWPDLVHIGEEAVLKQELVYTNDGPTTDQQVFGYNERYYWLKSRESQLSGLMRPGVANTLEIYNLAQTLAADPELGSDFIEEDPPMSRIKAVSDNADFLGDIRISLKCVRPLPYESTPGLRRF